MNIKIDDNINCDIIKHFEECYNFIENSNGNTLVMCQAGISRSSTITISYIMKKFNLSFLDSFQIVKKARKMINPNIGFVKQLADYEILLKQKN